jgi:tRNA threonylcarbamoyladenosine modification (KEOPS) complex  Pcc1 subunit
MLSHVKPEIEQAAVANFIERKQAERAESGVATAKPDHQEQPASRSKIKLSSRVRNKIEKRYNKTPGDIYK